MRYVTITCFALLLEAGCSGSADIGGSSGRADGGGPKTPDTSSPGDGGTFSADGSSGDGASGAGCGLALTGPKWTPSCQTWSDQYCCPEQKACAGDALCVKLIACLDACPVPRKDACVNACSPGGPALDLVNGFGACTKATPAGGPDIPSGCQWPQ